MFKSECGCGRGVSERMWRTLAEKEVRRRASSKAAERVGAWSSMCFVEGGRDGSAVEKAGRVSARMVGMRCGVCRRRVRSQKVALRVFVLALGVCLVGLAPGRGGETGSERVLGGGGGEGSG